MENNTNKIGDAINIPLIEPNANNNTERSNSFTRRTNFIPTPGNDHNKDEQLLKEMGFDEGMIMKVYLFLKPRNINEAIEMMTEVDGIYQHDFYESRATSNIILCYICKKGRRFHIDYVEDNVNRRKFLGNNMEEDIFKIKNALKSEDNSRKSSEKCLICFDSFNSEDGNLLECGHFCCENCMFLYLKTEIRSAKVAKLLCFVKGCDYELPEQFVTLKISKDKILLDKYKIFKQRAAIFLSKDKKFCPEPDCNSYLQEDHTNKYVQCENGHQYCYICLKKWHGKSKCDEELDKDFQIWSKNKVIKQCPRCKIYTEKNEGCNHMTCTECKYQWCWLCEGEYNDGHFSRGQCNGLQFARINYLSEKDKVPIRHRMYYHYRQEEQERGCCICIRNINDKFHFIKRTGPFGWYHGNKFLEYFLSIILLLFFFVPCAAISAFYEIAEDHNYAAFHNPILRFITVLMSLMLFICYQIYCTFFTLLFIIFALPSREYNILAITREENERAFELY